MKILILSDTHGDTSVLQEIKHKHSDANIVIHCGDSELPPFLTEDMVIVKGNCDYFDYSLRRDINIQNHKIHIEHGNLIRIPDQLFVENNDYDIVIFGHSHCAKAIWYGNKLFLNPGSLTRPRDSNLGSYIILEIDNDKVNFNIFRLDD
jgi:putative phosphoesterase